jgi:hypothetical protein
MAGTDLRFLPYGGAVGSSVIVQIVPKPIRRAFINVRREISLSGTGTAPSMSPLSCPASFGIVLPKSRPDENRLFCVREAGRHRARMPPAGGWGV